MSVLQLTSENFSMAQNSDKTVLIDFYADWCGPCRMVSPLVDQISEERQDVLVCKVNVDDQPRLSAMFGVTGIPMLVVMKNGEAVNQSIGAIPKQSIIDLINE